MKKIKSLGKIKSRRLGITLLILLTTVLLTFSLVGCNISTDGLVTFKVDGKKVETIKTLDGKIVFPSDTTLGKTAGYSISDWFSDEDCQKAFDKDAYEVKTRKKDITIYAKRMANSFKVNLELNEGIAGTPLTEYTHGIGATLPVDYSRTGYGFVGWYDNSNLIGNSISSIEKTESGDKTYWAKWGVKYNVLLNGRDGNGTQINEYTFGVGVSLPKDWTRQGYTFAGWYDNQSLSGKEVVNISATDFNDKTFWAKWKANLYNVTLNENGGTGGVGIVKYTYGKGVTLPINYTKTGYTFGGWYASSDQSGAAVSEITSTDFGDKTFWAKWTANTYNVSLNGEGGSGNAMTQYTYGKTTPLPIWTKEEFNFGGWYTNRDCTGTAYTCISSTDIGDKTFWASWTEYIFSVTLVTNGGTGGTHLTQYTSGTAVDLPNDWVKIGHTFSWYETPDFLGNPVARIEADAKGNKTFWAKWTANNYSVTLEGNGGMGTLVSEYTFGKITALPSKWTKEGYTFVGWYNNAELTGEAVLSIIETDIGNKIFYAKWKVGSYAVSLHGNEGTGPSLTLYTYGVGAILPTDWKRTGHEFLGWFGNNLLEGKEVTNISNTDVGDKEFWAKWKKSTYLVNLITNGGISGTTLTEYTYGDSIALPENYNRDTAKFDGWYTVPNFDEYSKADKISASDVGDKVFYAKWVYQITLEGFGSAGTNVVSYTYKIGTTLPVDWVYGDGTRLTGWSDTADDATRISSISNTDSGDKILYAQFGTHGLGYELIGDEFGVKKYIGSDSAVKIPRYFQGKFVTSLMDAETLYTGVFGAQKHITSFSLPQGLTKIGVAAFYGCTGITNIALPSSVIEIRRNAFGECSGLTNVILPDTVAVIGSDTFSRCTNLISIKLPNGLKVIETSLFYLCEKLKTVSIPQSVTTIKNSAFSFCRSLYNVVIPAGSTEIANHTFYNCTSLATVDIPNTVTRIGQGAFYGCTSFGMIKIHSSVTIIDHFAFAGATGLRSVFIPRSVTTIGEIAFARCVDITISCEILESEKPVGWNNKWNKVQDWEDWEEGETFHSINWGVAPPVNQSSEGEQLPQGQQMIYDFNRTSTCDDDIIENTNSID